MAQRSKATSSKANKKSRPKKAQSPVIKKQSGNMMDLFQLSDEFTEIDGGTIQAQVTRLGDPRLQRVQRQALAAQIGQVQGNRHLQRVMAALNDSEQKENKAGNDADVDSIQRHSIAEAPPLVEEEEVQTKPLVQRHSIANAPSPVEEEEVQPKPLLQRKSKKEEEVQGKPSVQRRVTNGGRESHLPMKKNGGALPLAENHNFTPAGGNPNERRGQPAFGKADVLAAKAGDNRLPLASSTGLVQRGWFDWLYSRAKFGRITFNPKEIPADNKTTSKASVRVTPAGREIKWGLVAPKYGSSIRASGSASGIITPGNDTQGKEKVELQVKVTDSKSTSFTTGKLPLYDAEYYQAKKDYDQFVADSPYKSPSFRPTNWEQLTKGTFDPYKWGRFDFEYKPKTNEIVVNIKVKFAFFDDQPRKGESQKRKDAREERHKTYRQTFIQHVSTGWSGKFHFKNVRSPESVWGKLNPTVKVNILDVEKMEKVGGTGAEKKGAKAPEEHWLIKWSKRIGIAEVKDAKKLVKFFRGDEKASAAFNPSTMRGELSRVRRITPRNIKFGPESEVVDAKYDENLRFLADYLKRINDPQFNLIITGYTSPVGKRKKADDQARSEKRAQAVEAKLKGFGLTNHTTTTQGRNARRWHKVSISPKMAKVGWRNVQDVMLHEFGHMIGLDDEYTRNRETRKLAEHYLLIKKAFGEKYAEEVSKIPGRGSASVMYGGKDIRIHHYVTFWQALYETTSTQAAVPKKKFGHEDWKLVG